jgi:hypothetical protein
VCTRSDERLRELRPVGQRDRWTMSQRLIAAMTGIGECGQTGDFAAGCLTGRPCEKAGLGSRLVWAVESDVRSAKTYDRHATTLTPILKREPDPGPLANLAGNRLRRYVECGRVDDAWSVWMDAQDHAASTGQLELIERQLSSAIAVLHHCKRYENVVAALGPLAACGALGRLRSPWRLYDTLGGC